MGGNAGLEPPPIAQPIQPYSFTQSDDLSEDLLVSKYQNSLGKNSLYTQLGLKTFLEAGIKPDKWA